MVIAGIAPNRSTAVARIAAPVGVVSSIAACSDPKTGMPRSSSAVAGAGTPNRPCEKLLTPPPTLIGDAVIEPMPSDSTAAQNPHDVGQRVGGRELVQVQILQGDPMQRGLDCLDALDRRARPVSDALAEA